jgi:phage-related protein
VEDFIKSLPDSTRLEVFDAVQLLETGMMLQMPVSRNLSGIRPGLHELRFRNKVGQVRIIYFIKKQVGIYLLHAFYKKRQELPRPELEVIVKRLKEI